MLPGHLVLGNRNIYLLDGFLFDGPRHWTLIDMPDGVVDDLAVVVEGRAAQPHHIAG